MLNWLHWVFHPTNPKEERDGNIFEVSWRLLATIILYPLNRLIHPNTPYFAPKAVRFLEEYLQTQRTNGLSVFEFGTGTSSYWWGQRVEEYIGIEHHQQWYEYVNEEIANQGLEKNAVIQHIPVLQEKDLDYNWKNNWKYYQELGNKPLKPEFRDYIFAIDSYPDHSFDIISIDGRERVGAALHAKDKVKTDGIVILDDSARPRYSQAVEYYSDWRSLQFDFGLQQTTIFFAPNNLYLNKNQE